MYNCKFSKKIKNNLANKQNIYSARINCGKDNNKLMLIFIQKHKIGVLQKSLAMETILAKPPATDSATVVTNWVNSMSN